MFYLSVVISLVLSYFFTSALLETNWAYLSILMSTNSAIYYPFYALVVGNNGYQVMTHLLTTMVFIGRPIGMIPGGSDKNQSCLNFTFHNLVDVLGWITYFILIGSINKLYAFLAAVHCSVGIVAFLDTELFQEYYIGTEKAPQVFHWLKIKFVTLDAICRTYALFYLFFLR